MLHDHHAGRSAIWPGWSLAGALLAWAMLALAAGPAAAQQPQNPVAIPLNADGTVNVQAICLPCRGFAQELAIYQETLADVQIELKRRRDAVAERTGAMLTRPLTETEQQQAVRDARAIGILEKSVPELEAHIDRARTTLQNCIREKCGGPAGPGVAVTPGGGGGAQPPAPVDPKPTRPDWLVFDTRLTGDAEEEARLQRVARIRDDRALCPACKPQETRLKEALARLDAAESASDAARAASSRARTAFVAAWDAYDDARNEAAREQAYSQRVSTRRMMRAAEAEESKLHDAHRRAAAAARSAADALAVCNARYCTGPDVRLEVVVPGGDGNNPLNPTDPVGGGQRQGGPGTIQFASASYSGGEGGGVQITVTRSAGGQGTASVDFSTDPGSATAGDFGAISGTLNWANGDVAPKFLTILLVDDPLVEPTESFTVRLSRHLGATRGSPDVATVTISDNDGAAPPAGALQFQALDFNVSEGAGAVTIFVVRVGGSAGAVSVDALTGSGTGPGSATAPGDYTATSLTLNWADGDAGVKSFRIPITNDAVPEQSERFFVTLNNNKGGASLGAPSTANVNIQDDDAAPAGVLQFQVASVTVNEGGNMVTLVVTRTGGAAGAVSVKFATEPDTAAASTDFTTTSGQLNWADGDAGTRNINITILNDAVAESTERFLVRLTDATGGAAVGGQASATVTIQDNDPPPEVGHRWVGNTGSAYACGPTPGSALCNPCPASTVVTLSNGQVTVSPIHGGGSATFVGNADTLTSQSSTLVFSGQPNHSMTITRTSNLSFRTNVTSSTGATCSVTCTRSSP